MGRKMKQAPVYFTIGQIQHNPVLNMSAYVPAIQESLRKVGYPDFKRGLLAQFDIAAAQSAKDLERASAPTLQQVERFLFLNAEGTRSVLLQPNSVSFQTTAYETFEVFLSELQKSLDVVSKAVGGLSYIERIGLRYLDAVIPREGEKLSEYLVAEVLGLPSRLPEDLFDYSFAESRMVAKGVGRVIARTLVQNGPLGFPPDLMPQPMNIEERFRSVTGEHAVIDTDGSVTERMSFDVADAQKRLTALHELIDKSFQATVTDHAREAWGRVME